MTSNSMTFGRPARISLPNGATWFASGAALLITALRRLDRWQLGLKQEQPRNAEEVLDWANRIEATEPGFAADLRAAALRSMDEPAR